MSQAAAHIILCLHTFSLSDKLLKIVQSCLPMCRPELEHNSNTPNIEWKALLEEGLHHMVDFKVSPAEASQRAA